MGYSLRIGEHAKTKENGRIYHDVEKVQIDNAPADGSPTDYTNQRWPSYSGWNGFIYECGLKSLSEGKLNVIKKHPGFVKLTPNHKQIIDKVYENKGNIPDIQHGRLEWLKFWVDWALINCTNPVFVNS